MKIIVLGSGVLGTSTAYFLAKSGHEVVVIDRQPSPAQETSFANAGEVSPGYSAPWAAPGVPVKAVKWMFMRHAPLILRPHLDPFQWKWMASMLRNCTSARYALNKGRMVRLAEYSRDVLRALRADIGITYDERSQGTLQLFRKPRQVEAAAADMAVLDQFGVPYEALDVEGCLRHEPGLEKSRIVGGLLLPGDETGDCFKFTNALAGQAAALGVEFRFNTTVKGLIHTGGRVVGALTDQGEARADAVVVALGSYSRFLLEPLGFSIPVYPVKGYSITLPIIDEARAPVSTILDETHKVAVTRLGDRIRVAGMAELNGYNLDLPQVRRETVEYVVNDLYPGGGDLAQAEFWCGLRPMTPDGTPIVGPTGYGGLYLNTGHGTLGWTMACGSGRVLADLISGKTPEIDMGGLTLDRYGRAA
ncbi:D-amino acid dehydrogenase small subunit [mine drainage metagenome]|uniref:D-amino acid dehydrogenase small subunit n=1 Tax=mine drainage metagenome TaxID=410659 RepID=A0A1J5QNA9_9ZZZZ